MKNNRRNNGQTCTTNNNRESALSTITKEFDQNFDRNFFRVSKLNHPMLMHFSRKRFKVYDDSVFRENYTTELVEALKNNDEEGMIALFSREDWETHLVGKIIVNF